jgi:RHS repeat-associated protein
MIRGTGLALALTVGAATRCLGATQTITTTYQYNADGASTAVTTQVDAQPATTTYLTWDNFTPNATQPSTGTVRAADGNLLGIGPSPGSSGLTMQFAYDVRDRLTGCSPAGQSAVSYAYDSTSFMASSTLASGDALQFYYDSSANPLMVNTLQSSTGMASSFLGSVRYLNDGTEQVLLQPRKDTAGVYDATAETLSSYAYDPYGAPLPGLATAPSGLSLDGTSYDLAANPFQYATEYQDPSCSAYYLRARWYLPGQRTFLSRDPADPLHRYSYTAGNPVGRTDPSGLRHTGGAFAHDVDKAVHKLAPGVWGYIEPVLPLWGQVMGGIEMLGMIGSFFHNPTLKGAITFSFLAASIVAEVADSPTYFDRLLVFQYHPDGAFASRLGVDLVLGGSQTAFQADQHGHLDVPALIQGIDTTVFGIFYTRLAGGFRYRPYNMTIDDVDVMSSVFHADDANQGRTLVFAARDGLEDGGNFTNPLLQRRRIGVFHESLLFVGRDNVISNEVNEFTFRNNIQAMAVGGRQFAWDTGDVSDTGVPVAENYRYVGDFADARVAAVVRKSPLKIPGVLEQKANIARFNRPLDTPYNFFTRNCQDHVAAMIDLLQKP